MPPFDVLACINQLDQPQVWSGMVALAAGAGLGYALRFVVFLRQSLSSRVYASLWEWARQRELDVESAWSSEQSQASKQAGQAVTAGRQGKPARSSHARQIQKYYRRMRRHAKAERQLLASLLHFALAMAWMGLAVLIHGSLAVRIGFWMEGIPLLLLIAAITFMGPWVARGVAFLLVAGSLFLAWQLVGYHQLDMSLGDSRPASVPLASFSFHGEPEHPDQAGIWIKELPSGRQLVLPWQEPWAPVRVSFGMVRYRWPLGLFLSESTAWHLRDTDSGRKITLPFLVWGKVSSPDIPTTVLAGTNGYLSLLPDSTIGVLYAKTPIADN